MPYFKRIDDYRTYSGNKFDFHFDYNANSGGGQAFLGGSYADAYGLEHHPRELEGRNAHLGFAFTDNSGERHAINLGVDPKADYAINPRATGSSQMKLGMTDKVRPSLVYPALLALPPTCGVNMAESLDVSPLTQGNYWLRSMWLDCEDDGTRATLIPRDYVFSGGSSKKGTQDGKVTGEAEFFLLDHSLRANDILNADSHAAALASEVASPLHYLAEVLRSNEPFSYEQCAGSTASLMKALARLYPELYSGYSDPLPTVLELLGESGTDLGANRRSPANSIMEPRNLIFFGAPGTGKSHQLNKLAKEAFGDSVRRVTFYPDYTYSQFVGCFKPVTKYQYVPNDGRSEKERASAISDDNACPSQNDAGEHMEAYISYEFVPGPFLETYMQAVQNRDEDFLLIVEEINRANPAAVFGDVFQLLDRDSDGRSEYEVAVPREMRSYFETFLPEYTTTAHISDPAKLLSERDRLTRETARLSLPPNMYIWATMNSADQGVFPMDTAFKRRWDFRYIGIDDGEDAVVTVGDEKKQLNEVVVSWGKDGAHRANWNTLRKAINNFLSNDVKVNEDKLLGPFFVGPASLTEARFAGAFKDKVLLYLYEDACKTKHSKVFAEDLHTYSALCTAFDQRGVGIFADRFRAYYTETLDASEQDSISAEE